MGESRKQLIARTLQERAAQVIPDASDRWPVVLGKMQQAQSPSSRAATYAASETSAVGPQPHIIALTAQSIGTRTKGRTARAYGLIAACLSVLTVLVLALLFGAISSILSPPSASAADLLQRAQAANTFVPAGKVRHLVVSTTENSRATNFSDITSSYEVWLTNGVTHLLLRKQGPGEGTSLVVGEDSVWDYNPVWRPGVVRTYAYDPTALKNFVPNVALVDQMLQMPNVRVVQNAKLEGRSVLLVEQTGEAPIGGPVSQGNPHGILSYRLWLDSATYQVLQHQHALREVENGVFSDKVDTGLSRIVLDEVKDSSQFPPDLFTVQVPPGAELQTVTGPTPK